MTRDEQETIINFTNRDKVASIYTSDPIIIKRLDNLVSIYPTEYHVVEIDTIDGEIVSKTYECAKRRVMFKKPIVMSEARKQLLREQLVKAREKQK